MFGTISVSGRKLTALSAMCFLVFLGVCLLMLRATAPDTVSIGGEPYPLSAEDSGDIESFISECGYTAVELAEDARITVPKTWNDVYSGYNELQLSQGFDLTPYKGREARRLVYSLADGASYAELLVCDGRIVAAHRCSMRPAEEPMALVKR